MSSDRTVLIVSPEPSVVQRLRDLLRPDYRVLSASGVPEAFGQLRAHAVHLVLSDHPLAEMSGVDFLRQVRRDFPDVSRFLFASNPDAGAGLPAAGSGSLFRYLRRPWDPDDFLPVLRQAAALAEEEAEPRDSAHARALAELGPGIRLGQYLLLDRLGQGGMGTVYKAVHTLLNRVVALKVLRPERLPDPRAVARFRREIKAAGQLTHPNVVQASDARKVRGIHFLVMEFVDGTDLAQVLARRGPLPVPDACEVARQAATGLHHAAEHGLVHRDVKPANLMLTLAGQVKVLDLGLALLYGGRSAGAAPTPSDYLAGTADYVAPEFVLGREAVDARADLYSLGCTFYELLTGRPPFSGPAYETVLQKLRAHTEAPVPPVRKARRNVPKGLTAVFHRLLAKDPARRFGTPAECAAALAPFTRGADLVRLLPPREGGPGAASPRPVDPQATVDYTPKRQRRSQGPSSRRT
jgi:serine/threonine protein kinase/CheY-like chemotaxis protein